MIAGKERLCALGTLLDALRMGKRRLSGKAGPALGHNDLRDRRARGGEELREIPLFPKTILIGSKNWTDKRRTEKGVRRLLNGLG